MSGTLSCAGPLWVPLSLKLSVAERPEPEVVLDLAPEAGEPFGLGHQEGDDEAAEENEAELRHEGGDVIDGHEAAEPFEEVPQGQRQDGDEGGAVHRADHAPQSSEDDHRQVL